LRRFERGTTSDTTRAARRLAIREQAITGVRPQDVDLGRRHVTVFGKGQKSRVIPLRGRIVLEIERYLLDPLPFLGRVPEPDDFVLYPEKRTAGGRILAAYPKRRMSSPTVHRWWYRHLQAAELVGAGMTSGLNMHRARHTFATDLRRVADLGAASQALGHSDLSTTAAIYGH
jgi:integrase